MAKTGGHATRFLPMPDNLHPTKFRCVTFYLPDDPLWYSNFWGTLATLQFPGNYQTGSKPDAFTMADTWAAVVEKARTNFLQRLCAPAFGSAGADSEDIMIRQDPDNPCLLQTSIDGINWCTFADFSKCIPASGQPGNGTPQPPAGGGTACYHANVNANSRWLIPAPVSAGDVIQINNPQGAVSNSFNNDWHCLTGDLFFAGACVNFSFTNGANPVPAAKTSSLIVTFSTGSYALLPGPFTVPVGVVNEQGTIQVNDANIAVCSGNINYDVCVTNNAAAAWSHTIDFSLDPSGWINHDYPTHNPSARWTAGVGWQANDCVNLLGGTGIYTVLSIERTIAPTTIRSVQMVYDSILGANPGGDHTRFNLHNGGGDNFVIDEVPEAGTPVTDNWIGSVAGVTLLQVWPIFAFANAAGVCDGTPQITLRSVTITGEGSNPF